MNQQVLKLVLTPVLIGTASLVGRRWGPSVSGWLVGLPLTSGPIIFFLALGHGDAFAAATATGALSGTISQVAFGLTYSWISLRAGWRLTVLAGYAAFFISTFALQFVALPLPVLYPVVIGALSVALALFPSSLEAAFTHAAPLPGWDLPARMALATLFVLLLTGLAPLLGTHLTGLIAPFPLYGAILAAFAHHFQGAGAAITVLRGLMLGLFSFASFCLMLAVLLDRAGAVVAFTAAIAVALAIQGGSLWVLRHAPGSRAESRE